MIHGTITTGATLANFFFVFVGYGIHALSIRAITQKKTPPKRGFLLVSAEHHIDEVRLVIDKEIDYKITSAFLPVAEYPS